MHCEAPRTSKRRRNICILCLAAPRPPSAVGPVRRQRPYYIFPPPPRPASAPEETTSRPPLAYFLLKRATLGGRRGPSPAAGGQLLLMRWRGRGVGVGIVACSAPALPGPRLCRRRWPWGSTSHATCSRRRRSGCLKVGAAPLKCLSPAQCPPGSVQPPLFFPVGPLCRYVFRDCPIGCGCPRARQQVGACGEAVRNALLLRREQLSEYGVLEHGSGARGGWREALQPPDARRCEHELVDGFFESQFRGTNKKSPSFCV